MSESLATVEIDAFRQNGDCSILIDFAAADENKLLRHIHCFANQIRQTGFYSVVNVIPAKTTLMLAFSTPIDSWSELQDKLLNINSSLEYKNQSVNTHSIPICYHPEIATDLETVLKQTGLDLEGLIKIHSSREYLVSMLGFLPGFMYLDELDQQLLLARKTTPAIRLPAGSVAISGNQCGLYSVSSPGGWHVIARTPQQLVDWNNDRPMCISALDKIRFKPISLDEFRHLEQAGAS
ncbi:MAG: carboxyltransferase domain-containing protein [Xanthomonadales bacterium]|nr:carboxyltransferase domain-containing protein [Xanthomonadales bacterium]